jgi:hypothetical protein
VIEDFLGTLWGFAPTMTNHEHVALADFYILERKAPSRPKIDDLAATIRAAINVLGVEPARLSGKRIAVTVGSRGIANLQEIVRTLCGWLKERGAQPFIIPAMGSHGGGTAEGQRQVLAEYGITEAEVGVPICASMETVVVGTTPQGFNIHADRLAWESDGIVVLNRIKPHSDLFGNIESGLTKMIAIGLGKREGATEAHRQFWKYGFEPTLRAVAGHVLAQGRIIFGLAVTENEMHEIAGVHASLPEGIPALDETILLQARAMLPRVPFSELDLLIIEEVGKNISGACMDLKVVGRCPGMPTEGAPSYSMIYLRNLTDESAGNAVGFGFADAIHDRLFRKVDFQKTYLNAIVSLSPFGGRTPMHLPSDRAAIDLTLGNLGSPEPTVQRIVWIRNTLSINKIAVSSAIKDQMDGPENWRLAGGPFPAEFDPAGDLRSPL